MQGEVVWNNVGEVVWWRTAYLFVATTSMK